FDPDAFESQGFHLIDHPRALVMHQDEGVARAAFCMGARRKPAHIGYAGAIGEGVQYVHGAVGCLIMLGRTRRAGDAKETPKGRFSSGWGLLDRTLSKEISDLSQNVPVR